MSHPAPPSGPPVFLLSAGGRTGSTLVQRLILSTGEVLVWGEHGGAILPGLQDILKRLELWQAHTGHRQYDRFCAEGWNQWIPNVVTPMEAFLEGTRSFLEASLGSWAQRHGYGRWGFKEIRYGQPQAMLLEQLWPEATFVLCFRHPASTLRSIRRCEWYGPQFGGDPARFLKVWASLSASLLNAHGTLQRSLVVRHEDLTSDPESALQRLAQALDLPAARLDRTALGTVLTGTPRELEPLDARDRMALGHPDVQAVARKLGYDLGLEP